MTFASASAGRSGWLLAVALLLSACTPSPDEQGAIGPEGGSVESRTGSTYCRVDFAPGALKSSVTFDVKAYSDPLDMARDTAPRFPQEIEPHLMGGGCFVSPGRPPYRDDEQSAFLMFNVAPIPESRRSLFADRVTSALVAFYRADPLGSWEQTAVGGSDFHPLDPSATYVFSRSLGYIAPVAALHFLPHVPGNTTVDEGAPIPLAFGLSGLYAPTADVEFKCFYFGRRDRDSRSVVGPLDCSLARLPEPGMRYGGEATWDPALAEPFDFILQVWVEARPRSLPPVLQASYDGTRTAHQYAPRSATRLTVVSSPPRIDSAPASVTVAEGQTAAFTVAASGSRPLAYQWQRNGVDLPGATGTTYTTPPTTAADDGAQFRVVVTNARGTTTTAAATLTVLPASAAPQITRGPLPITVVAGQPASFDVVATGAAPLAYQWLRDGTPIPGATASSYTLPTATLADNGALFAVRVSNAVNAAGVTSAAARLTVTSPGGLARGAGEIVSVRPDGTLGAADSSFGDMIAVSRDGRYVAFTSSAPLAGGTACGLFLRDMQARTTQLLSLRPDGTPSEPGAGGSCLVGRLAMTPDARHIVFVSSHTDLVDRSFGPGVLERVYVRDTCIGATGACTPRTTLVSVDDTDAALTTGSDYPSISDNGRYVAFRGRAPNQVAFTNAAVIHDRDADGNGVYDERPATPNPASPTFRSFAVSRRSDGTLFQSAFTPMISGNGRFVVFTGQINSAGNCTGPGQSTSICVYVYDRDADGNGVLDETTVSGGVRTVLVSVNSAGQPAQGGALTDPWISADGRVVTFRGPATNLGAATPSTNRTYAHDRDVAGTGFFDTPGNIATVVAGRDAQGNEADVDYALNPARGSRLGRFMLLAANANLAPPTDTSGSGFRHLFLRDLCIGAAAPAGCTPSTVRISVRSTGALPATALSPVAWFGALSADGQRVAFSQSGGGLVDLNGDGQPDEHMSREVYFGGTGTGEPL